ncbi:MAG: type II toxin-antitoxin system RelE/ParE family toxin [Candidatus Diapherotrites archaeon]|jgi:hypothetical protein|nr:type II toxin-antitoxin system RelE/ParE family toxin [Candidatus Diapherotrites archaeon]MBT4596516.1 type II toxin-antitoxin system RelE/ParE family toxin [Candidatus Diapherotrites archaeon]
MGFEVFITETFKKKIAFQNRKFHAWLEKVFDQLVLTPFVGKPLGVKWFREKKFENSRIYYIIFEDKKIVYIVNFSLKKDQQRVIDSTRLLFDKYRKDIAFLSKK